MGVLKRPREAGFLVGFGGAHVWMQTSKPRAAVSGEVSTNHPAVRRPCLSVNDMRMSSRRRTALTLEPGI